jgi:hypothetical protein
LKLVICGLSYSGYICLILSTDVSTENLDELRISEMNAMVDKVLAKRCEQIAGKDDRKFEVNPLDLSNGSDIVVGGGFHLYQFRSWS